MLQARRPSPLTIVTNSDVLQKKPDDCNLNRATISVVMLSSDVRLRWLSH